MEIWPNLQAVAVAIFTTSKYTVGHSELEVNLCRNLSENESDLSRASGISHIQNLNPGKRWAFVVVDFL